jgi:hypothetical protein
MKGGANISPDRKHRYSLWRSWDDNKPKILFIGLNPSRADNVYNDATITRCIRFAKDWGYGGLHFGNLFSYRTPYVTRQQLEAKKSIPDIELWEPLLENLSFAITDLTDHYLASMVRDAEKVVCCWGSWKFIAERSMHIIDKILPESYCFGLNQDGQPKHPLYLASNSKLQLFSRQKTGATGSGKSI